MSAAKSLYQNGSAPANALRLLDHALVDERCFELGQQRGKLVKEERVNDSPTSLTVRHGLGQGKAAEAHHAGDPGRPGAVRPGEAVDQNAATVGKRRFNEGEDRVVEGQNPIVCVHIQI
mmetsp:Transcript_4936/g.12806  ORF Transcript_4936/g.12806 Transcript_4936/m.12806 type:complete len:119 (+) Transcript_4936:93-449(+)